MSRKNKKAIKPLRCYVRAVHKSRLVDRTPVSPIAQKTSARILSNPKQKMTGSTRRRLQRSRGLVVNRPLGFTVTHPPEVKVTLRLQSLPMVKLIRRLKQAARRAATCKHLLLSLHAGSKYGPSIAAEQTHQLSLCRQISAEISVRNHNTTH